MADGKRLTVPRRLATELPGARDITYVGDLAAARSGTKGPFRHGACGRTWMATPNNVLDHGTSCPWCTDSKPPKREVHWRVRLGELMQRSNFDFISDPATIDSPFAMRCDQGHETSPRPSNLFRGSGCLVCASYGFDPSAPGHLYLMVDTTGTRANFGITSDVTRRRKEHERDDGIEYQVTRSHYFERGADAQAAEQLLLELLKTGGHRSLPGSREKFNMPVHTARCYFDLIVALDDRPGT